MSRQLHCPRVLIADDEGSMRTYLSTVIRQAGMETLEAPDGEEALRLLDRTPVDLVLADVCMPGRDGFGLLREVRRRRRRLPVILITGQGDTPSAVEAMKQGATDYLTKPLSSQELLSRIREVVTRQDFEDVAGAESCVPRHGRLACTHCNSVNLRPSVLRGVEPLFLLFLVRPYRCGVCLRRAWLPWAGRWLSWVPRALTYLLFEHRWAPPRSPFK